MDPIQETQQRLKGKNLSEVARRAGMAYRTVLALSHGKVDDIYVSTYRRIKAAVDDMEADECSSETTSKT